ncbi:unnamed protein product [Polarella glacialis]|uniref:Uncharacterized protein n=1 Tax=Polarella glacialis TaxID=89957 RepID=A0A813DWH4_POLGL|nr:unnamed protein product [Polarella glacialis]|mmetsp:Transcript_63816/g.114871  ORF Transcript_63816/g.114871 Transcript_63816/m.114871 type:complete len:532 (-) Transcript_63816:396-1991(-)
MVPDEKLVVGLLQDSGRINDDPDEDLEGIAAATLQRCTLNEKGLRALDLSSTLFTGRFLSELSAALSHNTQLVELYLDNCRVGDDGVRVLAASLCANKSNALKALSLEANQIRCHGAHHLAKVIDTRSDRWGRSHCGIRAPSMGPGNGFRYLSLKDNEVAAIGAKSLAQVLMRCDDSLEVLNLEGNKICDWGAGWLAMALRNHGTLQCLNLCGNPIGTDGLEELKSACSTADGLLVASPSGPGDRCVVPLVDLMAEQKQAPCVFVSEVLSRPACISKSSRPSSAARTSSRPTSAARSRPSSAFSRASSDASTAVPGAFRPPGSASHKIPITLRRPSPSPPSDLEGQITVGVAASSQEEAGMAQPSDVAAAHHAVHAGSHSPARLGRAGKAASRSAGLPHRLLRNGKPNPHWPPHPWLVVNSRRALRRPTDQHLVSSSPAISGAFRQLQESQPKGGGRDAESMTVLSSPSRWRWKPRNTPEGISEPLATGPSGCGAAAARGIRHSHSVPDFGPPRRRIGALLGPAAALAMAA